MKFFIFDLLKLDSMKMNRLIFLFLITVLHLQCSSDQEDNPTPSNPPIADFDALATSIRAGTRVQFVNLSANATSYEWTFPGGTPGSSTEVDPFIQYLNPGTYDVTLKAINNEGESTLTRENFITVLDPDAP